MISSSLHLNQGLEEEMAVRATSLYDKVSQRGSMRQFFARLLHRKDQLLDFNELTIHKTVHNSTYTGLHTVDIEKIRGSEGRSEDFDSEFNPLRETTRERWLRIARAFLTGQELPPVELLQVGDIYFIRDGHHRVSVAHSLGQRYIEAEVTLMDMRRLVV